MTPWRAGHTVREIDPRADKMHEDCGIIAVYRPGGNAAELAHRGLFALQHRGQEAAGICTLGPTDELHHLRGRGLVAEALPTYQVKKLPGEKAIGHVRYSTVTADRTENIQPFVGKTPYGRLALAHNGNLKNTDALHDELEASGSILSTSMDTELLAHLIARSGASSFEDALRATAARSIGAYSLTMISGQKLLALRDSHGIRPLVLGKMGDDGWVIASETCALDALGADYVREIRRGELCEIGPEGVRSVDLLGAKDPAPCVFELVYFARPDSTVFGQSVHDARTAMGEQLAELDRASPPAIPADIVVPIPDSGFPAAIGYARKSGIPLEKAIIRSHYIGRTFILPDQDSRTHSLRLKLSVIRSAVKDKVVLLIDDSIVRGNTSRIIVDMVREAGARKVYMRIASPPLSWPCYLGINTPSREELIVNQNPSIAAVAESIGVDDLRYLSLEGLQAATAKERFCFGCMTGGYPV
jgi:amidophosphoribosyltransferase